MQKYAVLTCDVVNSRNIAPKGILLDTLKKILIETGDIFLGDYELYRGDSFQVLMPTADHAINAAIAIRAGLIAQSPSKREKWDARVAIGIGEVNYEGQSVAESDGEAFILSGLGLNELYETKARLIIKTPYPAITTKVALVTKFADSIISNWTARSGEIAYMSLLQPQSQHQMAQRLDKAQSTIARRLATAKFDLIQEYIGYVNRTVREDFLQ